MRTPALLRSLQVLELVNRLGTLKDFANHLGITPATVAQRIRAIEDYLGTDLLLRSHSRLKPAAAELAFAIDDLRTAFAALDRGTEALDLQHVPETHIVADPDWAQLWLMPRLAGFRARNPNILFCINGVGDVPLRLGAPDCRIVYGAPGEGEMLYRDILLPVTGPDNLRRLSDEDDTMPLECMPRCIWRHSATIRTGPARPPGSIALATAATARDAAFTTAVPGRRSRRCAGMSAF